jgi:3-oxoacyl-[acyl-carrier protein] reductase
MNRIDEIKVGDSAEIVHAVTANDLARFVELTGDDNKLHTDADYAAKTSFKKPVAHGMLGAAFISTVIGTRLPGDGALWFAQNLEFLLPVRVGDTLTVRVEVTKKLERERVVELKTEIFNQHRQKVTDGSAKVRIIEQQQPSTAPPPAGASVKVSAAPKTSATAVARVRTALIIGGSGGIGRAVCGQLARDGFTVAVHYHRNRAAAEETAQEIARDGRAAPMLQADITDPVQVAKMFEETVKRIGTISVMVDCSAGHFAYTPFSALDWPMFEAELAVNVRGPFHLSRAFVPAMIAQSYGKLIFITSQASDAVVPELAAYITAKSALNGFARALAVELAPKGVRVNLVSPGMTDTGLIADVPERTRLLVAARTPLRRLASPIDVAGAVSFLASDKGDFLTGETIRVNGGQTML